MYRYRKIPATSLKLTSPYWREWQRRFCEEVLERQWQILNGEIEIEGFGRSHCVDNFRIAAGEMTGKFTSYWFSDHELYKWMEAAAYSLSIHPTKAMEEHLRYATDLFKKAQWEDGYLNTYYTVYEPGRRWTNFALGHEMLNIGNLLEAGIAWYVIQGEKDLLDVAVKCVHNLEHMLDAGGRNVYDGHEEIEIALIKLHVLTGEERYLKLAERLINGRGRGRCPFLDDNLGLPLEYYQAHQPVREQHTAEGHAVRAMYLYTAMTELGAITDDRALLDAAAALWKNMVEKRIYITAGIGSEDYTERFTPDYDLPNDRAYSETCAGVGLMMFARAMLQVKPDAGVAEVMETALYNTVMAGISMDGKRYFYVNPLYVRPEVTAFRHDMNLAQPNRQEWMNCPCCPPNLARLVMSLGEYVYTYDDSSLYLNLWLSNELDFQRAGRRVALSVEGNEPWDSCYHITAKSDLEGALYLKKPLWAGEYTVTCGGEAVSTKETDGYIELTGIRGGTALEVSFDIRPRFVYSHPQVEDASGKAAVQRGYIVYCAEEADNGACLSALAVDDSCEPTEIFSDSFGAVPMVRLAGTRLEPSTTLYSYKKPTARDCDIRMVPYSLWNNRGEGEMSVWLKVKSV